MEASPVSHKPKNPIEDRSYKGIQFNMNDLLNFQLDESSENEFEMKIEVENANKKKLIQQKEKIPNELIHDQIL